MKDSLTAVLTIAATLIAFVNVGFAQSTEQQWEECIENVRPDTENVQPSNYHGDVTELPITERARAVLDTDPTRDQVVIDFYNDISNERLREFGEKRGMNLELNSQYSDEENIFVANVKEGAVPRIEACLNKHSADWIQAVDENAQYSVFGEAPNDPLYQFQWNFDQINAEDAWETSTAEGVKVAVIDTGVALDEDASRNIERPKDLEETTRAKSYDFVDDDEFAWDGHGHGTHVAGTIAQTTNNKFGVAGVAHDASIMALRVLNDNGYGQLSDIADAIRFAADNGADVINMSLGGPIPSLVLKRAINYAHDKGVTIIAAAGNSGKRAPSYPAAYEHVIAVSATQYDKTTTFYSQWGKFVDIAAPGGNTKVDQNDDGRPDGVMQQTLKNGQTDEHDFVLYMGTSMASPHAAAVASLVHEQGITHPDKVESVLKNSTDESMRDEFDSENKFKEKYGAGITQADEAVENAATSQGSLRFGAGFLIALLGLIGLRRKDSVETLSFQTSGTIAIASAFAASGLFFAPLLVGDVELLHGLATTLSHPIAEADLSILGVQYHQNPLFASFLIPLGAYALLGGSRKGRLFSCVVAFGLAGFCAAEVFSLTSDVLWVPGINLLDRGWLAFNGLISAWIGYNGLK